MIYVFCLLLNACFIRVKIDRKKWPTQLSISSWQRTQSRMKHLFLGQSSTGCSCDGHSITCGALEGEEDAAAHRAPAPQQDTQAQQVKWLPWWWVQGLRMELEVTLSRAQWGTGRQHTGSKTGFGDHYSVLLWPEQKHTAMKADTWLRMERRAPNYRGH